MDRISRIFSGGRIPHSFLITGEEGAEKEAFALRLARALLCEGDVPPCGVCNSCTKSDHPDLIHALTPSQMEAAKDKIGVVRNMIASAHVLPNDAQRKVYLIFDAARLTVPQQNVLLATIEEPPRHACFILTANHASDLIPTVVSRCSQMKLSCSSSSAVSYLDEATSVLAPLAEKDELGLLRALTALEKSDRAEFREILEACRTLLRDSALRTLPPLATPPAFRFTHAEFSACCEAIDLACDGITRNLGVAIISGALCARLMRVMSAEEEQ